MTKELSINKLIILYMLDYVAIPLTNSQIAKFIIGNDYANYFSFQKYINQLVDDHLIQSKTNTKHTTYQIVEDGIEILNSLLYMLPGSIIREIQDYITTHQYEIKESHEVFGEYIPIRDEQYQVHLVAKDRHQLLLELNLTVYSLEMAVNICNQWEKNYTSAYKDIIKALNT